MKKIIAIAAVMAFSASMASAELLKNFKYDGSVEVNAYNQNNGDFNKSSDDKTGDVDSRVMINASFDLNNDVNAVVSVVKNNRQYGDASEDANTIQNNLFFEQAYLNLKGVFGMDHKLGRQYYGKAGDLVIYYGPKMWPYPVSMPVSAIDGWTGWYKTGNWDIHAIMANEYNDTTLAKSYDQDSRLSGINASTKIDRFNLNAYYYQKNDKEYSSNYLSLAPSDIKSYLGLFGVRANWESMFLKGLNLGLEYDMNTGKDKTTTAEADYKGYAYKVNADYAMDFMGKLGFNAEYVYLSGQDNSSDVKLFHPINSDYRPGIIGNGFGVLNAYVTAIGDGAKVMDFGVNWTPEKLNKLNLAVSYYNTKVAEKNPGMKDTIGNEYNLVASWNHSENVSVKGYYAMFTPEKDNNGGQDDAQTALGAAFVVKF
ncbi:MAG: porin [Elusimicrobia bacterium]|nr:porin [Elusimicrobiota bacterium]